MSEKPSVLAQMAYAVNAMPVSLKRGLIIGAIVLGGGIAGWIGRGVLTGPPDTTTVTLYQDWQLICPASKDKDKHCEIIQDVVNEKIGRRVARISMGYIKQEKQPSLMLTVPLGVLLEPGLGLKLGVEDMKAYPYKTCVDDGCVAIIPIDKKLDKSLIAAQDASLAVVTPQGDGKPISLPFSMKGFAQAHRAYLSGEAKRNSWFWRLWL
jgi:invasion protein IalB